MERDFNICRSFMILTMLLEAQLDLEECDKDWCWLTMSSLMLLIATAVLHCINLWIEIIKDDKKEDKEKASGKEERKEFNDDNDKPIC